MFCTNCGFQFEGNFCPQCGTPIQSVRPNPASYPLPPMGFRTNPIPPPGSPLPGYVGGPWPRTTTNAQAALQITKMTVGILSILVALLDLALIANSFFYGYWNWLVGENLLIFLCCLAAGILGIAGRKSPPASWVACGLYALLAVPQCIEAFVALAGAQFPFFWLAIAKMLLPIGVAILFGVSTALLPKQSEINPGNAAPKF